MASVADLTAHGMHTDGFWGPITSTLDWCEANYQFSHYVAELANSFSNLFTIGLALLGVVNTRRQGMPLNFTISFLLFAVVGLGSFAFHASLLYSAQLADELPMIYLVSHGFFSLFDTKPGFNGLKDSRTRRVLVAEVLFNVLFTWTYAVLYRNPMYHQLVFGLLDIGMVVRGRHLLQRAKNEEGSRALSNGTGPKINGDSTHRKDVAVIPESVRKDIRYCITAGPLSFTLGFLLWNLDNIFCGTITTWKRNLGWPFAFLLEGHSWWHICTGYGGYLVFTGVCYLGVCVKDDYRRWRLRYRWTLPIIENVEKDQKFT